MKIFGWIMLGILAFTVLGIGCNACHWLGRASQVAMKELDPGELLRKYEQFKDQSAALDAKVATLDGYKMRYQQLLKQYGTTPRAQWDRTDKEQVNQWMVEVGGLVGSYNTLASQYNSEMSKINYRFCNIGDLPKGAENPLPREYKPYINTLE
jgi:hypothetical protein